MVVMSGCIMPQPVQIQTASPEFRWEPPGKEPSQHFTVALVLANFSKESKFGAYRGKDYFKLFTGNLATDLNRALLAKGFTVAGPFASLEEMTYPDKKAAPIVLSPEVVVVLDESYSENRTTPSFGGKRVSRKGTVTVTAFVKLLVVEPMSNQTIWLKRVEVPESSLPVEVDLLMDSEGNLNRFHNNVDNSDAVVVEVLNRLYPEVLRKFWNYLNPEEMGSMRKAAEEVRSRKVY
ncbi:MAG: HpaA family protein [Actinomycetota bacterium]